MIRLTKQRRETPETIVPMINVAFLLLIFFLMAAVLAPPDPVDVTPPIAEGQERQPDHMRITLGLDGTLLDDSGRVVEFSTLDGVSVRLLADKSLPAQLLASTVSRLAAAGASSVTLTTLRP